ncbi:unnamed protein product [Rhizophagus irregularis]|nr:unnamed protein product [Rhizophagus irregularis]
MEEAVEDSCTLGDIKRIWLVRNKKMIYKGKKKKKGGKGKKDQQMKKPEVTQKVPSQRNISEPDTPMTPPDRIYRELGNFASQKDDL